MPNLIKLKKLIKVRRLRYGEIAMNDTRERIAWAFIELLKTNILNIYNLASKNI